MSKTFEFVNHPSQFENEFLRQYIPAPPEPADGLKVDCFYLAVFDRDVNYPTEESYKELLTEHLISPTIVETVLTKAPQQQLGMGDALHDMEVSLYPFVNETEGDVAELEVVYILLVDRVTDANLH